MSCIVDVGQTHTAVLTRIACVRAAHADEAVPKTPPVASVSPTRRAAVDATSTLLNFLKQEQAVATDSLTKPNASPQEQGQPSSSNADSKQDAAVAIPGST